MPHTPRQMRGHVVLGQHLGAGKCRVLLGIDDLVELRARTAQRKVIVALGTREALEDEVGEVRAIDRQVEAEIALWPLEADLEGIRALDRQVRVADLEGGRGIVGTLVEQLRRVRCPLDVLRGEPGDDAVGQVVEEPGAYALGNEGLLDAVWTGSSGGGKKLAGKVEAVPLMSSLSIRPATWARNFLVSCSSSNTKPARLWVLVGLRRMPSAPAACKSRLDHWMPEAPRSTPKRVLTGWCWTSTRVSYWVCRKVEPIEKTGSEFDLIVLVVGGAEPEADSLHPKIVDAPFAAARPLGLIEDDVVLVLGRLDAGDEVGAVERRIGDAEKPSRKT